ncbi:hypothetical protein CLCR_04463 [Cladophialophora carrionii]|uniref:Uncharacterized protein n=1 Tax=Cladophialophora carrionii TaxID=86049 RepID=A0A1C1CHM5_9EURO|nr:hypothetical protein CLCR_04463 [Cladophialophora carrionii]
MLDERSFDKNKRLVDKVITSFGQEQSVSLTQHRRASVPQLSQKKKLCRQVGCRHFSLAGLLGLSDSAALVPTKQPLLTANSQASNEAKT